MPAFDKELLLETAVQQLNSRLQDMTRRARAAAESAVHPEARAENDKDTRAIEESYLARGQANRAAELDQELQLLRATRCRPFSEEQAIAATAVVWLEDEEGAQKVVFLAPAAGGLAVHTQDTEVLLLTPRSPLGRALMGRSVDDEVELRLKGAVRRWTIEAVV